MKKTITPLEHQRDEHRVHLIAYRLIWCPRRRKSVLTGPIAHRCRELIREKCQEKSWEIIQLDIQPEHVHLLIRAWPTNSAAEVVKECKRITAHHLRHEFPALLKLPSMWTRSYFASTAGDISQETIQRYIDAQKGI
ncbi:MAG TPA: IS200/IS605 family transposase [Marinobacter sp.]|nr:IS200/IS605 family transposase [Marinobacter sp.]